jgi:predicted DNA-binding transcriptional regulator AlpA
MMSLDTLVSERDYAKLRQVSLLTVQRERRARKCPSFIKLGRKIFYRQEAIDAWLDHLEVHPPKSCP